MRQPFNRAKFKELVMYIAERSQDDGTFGATKLNKLLFYSDFLAFRRLGKAITAADYVALKWGPAPSVGLPVQKELIESGDAVEERRELQRRLRPIRPADTSQFTSAELMIVGEVIDSMAGHNAKKISDLSHFNLGWKAAWAESEQAKREVRIPYGTVHVMAFPIIADEAKRGLSLARQYDWN